MFTKSSDDEVSDGVQESSDDDDSMNDFDTNSRREDEKERRCLFEKSPKEMLLSKDNSFVIDSEHSDGEHGNDVDMMVDALNLQVK